MKTVENERHSSMLDVYNFMIDGTLRELMIELIYVIGAILILQEEITLGGIFAFTMYLSQVLSPLSMLMNIKYVFKGILPSSKRYFEFLALQEEATDGKVMFTKQSINADDEPIISFDKVNFAYEKSEKILNNISFNIYSGEKVAICGKNGSGKSTLIRLIMRLYEPMSGVIKYCGENINLYDLAMYRDNFSVLGQKAYLFDKNIVYNIAFEENVDMNMIRKILNRVGLQDFLEEKTLLDSVGNNGSNLSGGQRQKLALARVLYKLYKGSEIFIFDEAGNNLDVSSKRLFYELLHTELKDKTVLFITHENDALQYADKVIRLN